MFVYQVINLVNGKKYIGQHSGKDLQGYWRRTILRAKRLLQSPRLLYKAIRKYGPENFEIKALVIVGTSEEMDRYEIDLIKAWNTTDPEKGYNLALGGRTSLGTKFSAETRARFSELRKGKPGNKLGKKASEETRRKISAAGLGRRHTEATRIQMSESQRLRRQREAQYNG